MADSIITVTGDDGENIEVTVADVFDLQGVTYALLIAEADDRLVIMRLVDRDGAAVFQTIQDDDEFARVAAHIEELANAHDPDAI